MIDGPRYFEEPAEDAATIAHAMGVDLDRP